MKALTDVIIEELNQEKKRDPLRNDYIEGLNYAISTITDLEKDADFDEIARMMMKHLANIKKYHPHYFVFIDSTNGLLLEGEKSTGIVTEYIKD